MSCADSCREQTEHGPGVFVVVEREWPIEAVRPATSWEERWRYKHRKTDDPIKPRQIVADHLLVPHRLPDDACCDRLGGCCFDFTLPLGRSYCATERITDFNDLLKHELWYHWKVAVAGVWQYDEVIHVTEAQGVCYW